MEIATHISLVHTPIDLAGLYQPVVDDQAGGVVLFVGTTRRWTKSDQSTTHQTEYLFYEAYEPMALAQLQKLAQQAADKWPLRGLAIVHRLGKVLPTEASIALAVSSPHRTDSFEAAQWLMDRIKQEVPIWKREHYSGRSSVWIHPGLENHADCQPSMGKQSIAELPNCNQSVEGVGRAGN